MDELFAIEMNF